MWLIDVARAFPDAQLFGLDINLAHMPSKNCLPGAVQLRKWNIFEEPPEDLRGKFDMVHTRLLIAVVKDKDPRPILRNFAKLLKPGGYIQWDETGAKFSMEKTEKSLSTPGLDGIASMLYHWFGKQSWTSNLSALCTQEGFFDAAATSYRDSPELRRALTETLCMLMEELTQGLVAAGQREAGVKYGKFIDDANEEMTQGAALGSSHMVCIARKPLGN